MRNPLTAQGSEYPEGCWAYHSIFSEWDDISDIYRNIVEGGALLSLEELGGYSEHTYPTDWLAGDAGHVFLTLGRPSELRSDEGYIFVFDPRELVEKGAVVGMKDLDGSYRLLAMRHGEDLWEDEENHDNFWFMEPDKVLQEFRKLQSVTRFTGSDALRWIDWACGEGEKPNDLIEAALNFASIDGQIPINPRAAQRMAEILFPKRLSLDLLVGVVENRKFAWV